jgi:hypothetical protein
MTDAATVVPAVVSYAEIVVAAAGAAIVKARAAIVVNLNITIPRFLPRIRGTRRIKQQR